MKKRILAVLLILALSVVPAFAAGEKGDILTKDGPVWLATRPVGERRELIYSENQGKNWYGVSGIPKDEGFYVQDIQYTGKNYFMTFTWCKGAFISTDGRTWSSIPEREWFIDNASYITNALCSGNYQLLWTGSEYMMCQNIQGDPRRTSSILERGPNPRNKMVTFLDENFNILGAMEFDGEMTGIRCLRWDYL